MISKRLRRGSLLIAVGILIAACSGPSRVASTPVGDPGLPSSEPTQVGEATDAPSQVETLMAGELATQTAIAGGGTPMGEETAVPSATPEPTLPPAGEEPTAVPTATEVPPTEEPEPEPETDCTSPYTVQKGDWVWDIGRRCNIHPQWIIAANNLYYPYTIYPGDVLILPADAPPFPGP